MGNLRRLRKSAARHHDSPTSAKEKLSVLIKGLTGMVNAIDQNRDTMPAVNCGMMAEHLLGLVGFKLKKQETKNESEPTPNPGKGQL